MNTFVLGCREVLGQVFCNLSETKVRCLSVCVPVRSILELKQRIDELLLFIGEVIVTLMRFLVMDSFFSLTCE